MEDLGFEIAEGVVTSADCDALLAALSGSKRSRAGARHVMSDPAVRSLARRKDLLALARRYVGPGAVPCRATLFEKSGRSNWLVVPHQDTTLPPASRSENSEWGRKAKSDPSVDCLVGRGGVLSMRPLLIHASSKAEGSEPRRVLHVEYAASLELGDGLRLVIA